MSEWVTDRFDWLLRSFGPRRFFEDTSLVLPTRAFFKTGKGETEAHAQAVFDEVRGHMGLSGRSIKLVPRATTAEEYGMDTLARSSIAGTFYRAEGEIEPVITYNPLLMRTPRAFIGTLAHELAHVLLDPYTAEAPGGEEEMELLTDLTVIFSGFGLIDISGARQMGWSGYLQTDGRAFGLATFLRLKGIGPEAAEPFLDSYLRRRLARALRQRDAEADALKLLLALKP